MSVKLLTEHHLEFLILKGGCTGSSESILVKIPLCLKSHDAAHMKTFPADRYLAYFGMFCLTFKPAITFFLKMLSAFLVCCIHSNALQTRLFQGYLFTEDNVIEEQSDLGPYCLHIRTSTVSYKNINRLGKQTKSGKITVH